MPKRKTTREVNAPVDVVFNAITDIESFPQKSPDIVSVEILTQQKTGVGTRFRETRRMNNRETSTTLECTEYVENERVRFVTDQGGAVWDSIYYTKPRNGKTELVLEMDARPHQLMAKIAVPLMLGVVGKHVEKDMDAVKTYCEQIAG